jgi:hypothetical protein
VARRLVCHYAKGEPGASRLRARAQELTAVEAIIDLACEFLSNPPS